MNCGFFSLVLMYLENRIVSFVEVKSNKCLFRSYDSKKRPMGLVLLRSPQWVL